MFVGRKTGIDISSNPTYVMSTNEDCSMEANSSSRKGGILPRGHRNHRSRQRRPRTATSFSRAGYEVIITSRDPQRAAAVATETGTRLAASNAEAAAAATSWSSRSVHQRDPLRTRSRDAVVGKPVVDASNRMSFGPQGPAIDTDPSNAERLATWLPEAHVVKAFNTLFASNQADPVADGVQLDGFVAGDDESAKATVLELVRSIGLNPVDVGPLARAQQLEQLAS